MSNEPSKQKILTDVAQRAQAKQPDEIRLQPASDNPWTNPNVVEAHAAAFKSLGFAESGTYTIDVLPVTVRFLIKKSERLYSVIYEHQKAGVWINIVVLYNDDTSHTFTNTQDRGLEKRPGHPVSYATGAMADKLYTIALPQCRDLEERMPLTTEIIPVLFEKAWADGIRWRKSHPISDIEVASVFFSRNGQPTRVLRPERIRFVAEQDGIPERKLKAALTEVFDRFQSIDKAYLARVSYDESTETSVTLCLSSSQNVTLPLVEALTRSFASLFNKDQHLDMLIVRAPQLAQLEAVCRPFYSQKSPAR